MQDDATNDRSIHLSRKELRFLMELLQASAMVGVESAADDPTVASAQAKRKTMRDGQESLIARGMARPGGPNGRVQIQGRLLQHVLPCLFPERALLMVRDLPKVGQQVLIVFRRGESAIMHSFPEPGSHRLEALEGAADVAALAVSFFPLQPQEVREVGISMPLKAFDTLRMRAEKGNEAGAVEVLDGAPLNKEEKLALVRAIEHRAISGSFATLSCQGDKIVDAESLALVADPLSGWLISQPRDDPKGTTVGVSRIGAFDRLAVTMAAWLMGR